MIYLHLRKIFFNTIWLSFTITLLFVVNKNSISMQSSKTMSTGKSKTFETRSTVPLFVELSPYFLILFLRRQLFFFLNQEHRSWTRQFNEPMLHFLRINVYKSFSFHIFNVTTQLKLTCSIFLLLFYQYWSIFLLFIICTITLFCFRITFTFTINRRFVLSWLIHKTTWFWSINRQWK